MKRYGFFDLIFAQNARHGVILLFQRPSGDAAMVRTCQASPSSSLLSLADFEHQSDHRWPISHSSQKQEGNCSAPNQIVVARLLLAKKGSLLEFSTGHFFLTIAKRTGHPGKIMADYD